MEVIVFVRTRLRKFGHYVGTVSLRILGKLKHVMFEFTLTKHHTPEQQFLVRRRDKSQRRAMSVFLNYCGQQLSADKFPECGAAFFKLVRDGIGKTISRLERQLNHKTRKEGLRSDCRYRKDIPRKERGLVDNLVC